MLFFLYFWDIFGEIFGVKYSVEIPLVGHKGCGSLANIPHLDPYEEKKCVTLLLAYGNNCCNQTFVGYSYIVNPDQREGVPRSLCDNPSQLSQYYTTLYWILFSIIFVIN